MTPSFHLSLPVRSIDESVEFYTSVLQATVTHRDPSGYVNLDLYGTQITLQPTPTLPPPPPNFHFGVNLSIEDFDHLAARLGEEVRVVDQGTPMERKKLYLRCPSGYTIEVKGYR